MAPIRDWTGVVFFGVAFGAVSLVVWACASGEKGVILQWRRGNMPAAREKRHHDDCLQPHYTVTDALPLVRRQ